MNEGLGGVENLPDHRIIDLYRRWGEDNWGMLLTGALPSLSVLSN